MKAYCDADLELDKEPTLFSQSRFVNAISRTIDDSARPIELRCASSGSSVHAVERRYSFGRRSVAIAPFGLYACPSHRSGLSASVTDIVGQLKTWSTIGFEWNVRFDHEDLAQHLLTHEIPFHRTMTHVLYLDRDYKSIFTRFNSTTRNLVRRAKRDGLLVRATSDASDVDAYYRIYTGLASQKGNYGALYPEALFHGLLTLHDDVVFVVAVQSTKVIGGAWFFRDGDTLLYWHAAMDLNYSRYSPSYAIIDYAIRTAAEEGRAVFNFGASIGIASLEQFKAKWGAEPEYCWSFKWRNPMWQTVKNMRNRISAYGR